jgi:hypothetical protein
MTPLPTDTTPCTEGACLHAHPAGPCTCTACHGTGHGHITVTAWELGRAKHSIRTEAAGGVFAALAAAGGLATDDEEW